MSRTFNPVIWSLLWPLRSYIRHFPISRGKGIVLRYLILPALPHDGRFIAPLPLQGKVELHYRETLGLSILLRGGFENAELAFLCQHIPSHATVVDVGANVGIFTIAMGHVVGPQGRVLAFEPLANNVARLQRNIALNGLENVSVYACAVGECDGETPLHLADDPAFASTTAVKGKRGVGRATIVPLVKLDRIWREAGTPCVAAMKLDVEGGELSVLKGSEELLRRCRPLLLLEADTPEYLACLTEWLAHRGYIHVQPKGFSLWNHVFMWKDIRQCTRG